MTDKKNEVKSRYPPQNGKFVSGFMINPFLNLYILRAF